MAHISNPVAGDPFHPDNAHNPQPGVTSMGTGTGLGTGTTGTGMGTGVGPGLTGAGADVGSGARHTAFADTAPGTGHMGTGTGTMGTGTGTGATGTGTGTGTAMGVGAATGPNVIGDGDRTRRSSRFAGFRRSSRGMGTGAGTDVPGSRRSSGVPLDIGTRRGSLAVKRASLGDPALFHAHRHESGWRGLFANRRSLAVALFASLGGLLYGYNQGVFGQVQVMQNFYYRYQSTLDIKNSAPKKGMLTAILELGAFVGALMAGPLADRYSRKYSISGWCVLFIMGTIIQVAANRAVACIYAGRWFAGMAVGALSMLVPMWNAEVASPGIRGALVALQQLAITFGILVSYWIAYGTNYIGGTSFDPATGQGQTTAAWRVPLAIQIAPAIVLCIGACFLPFSPRWLMLRGRERECLDVLCYLRNGHADDPRIDFEFKSLLAERLAEKRAAQERYGVMDTNWRTSLGDYRRLLTTKPLLHRLMIGAGAQALQQWTGINAIIYYAPTIFTQLGLTGNTSSLLATGVVGIVNFIFTIPAVMFVDLIGRRPGMIWGAANMAISHATIAAIIAVYGDRFDTNKKAGNGAIFMVYWFIVNFAITWGPMAWIVSAEVWPLQYRSRGMSLSSATNWIMNFTVAEVTPVMIANIGYKTYIVFMCFCVVGCLWAIFLLPELKGLSLEQIDEIFGDSSGAEDIQRRAAVAHEVGLDEAEHKLGIGEKADRGLAHDEHRPLTATVTNNTFSTGTHTPRHSGGPGYKEKDGDMGLRGAGSLEHQRGLTHEPGVGQTGMENQTGLAREPGLAHDHPLGGPNAKGQSMV